MVTRPTANDATANDATANDATANHATGSDAAGDMRTAGPRLDRSISARHHHHMIACHHCAADLRVPGRMQPRTESEKLTLTCPHCLATFCHQDTGKSEIPDRLIIALGAALIVGGGLLWAEYEGLVELRNLGNGTWLAPLHQIITNLLAQLNTAAMARLV